MHGCSYEDKGINTPFFSWGELHQPWATETRKFLLLRKCLYNEQNIGVSLSCSFDEICLPLATRLALLRCIQIMTVLFIMFNSCNYNPDMFAKMIIALSQLGMKNGIGWTGL